MPTQFEWLRRIKAVEREYAVVLAAVSHFREVIRHDPLLLPSELQMRDCTAASNGLEATYIVRMFAEFEAGLRQFWQSQRPTRPQMRDLLDRIAARQYVSFDSLSETHAVRELRNGFVHGSDSELEKLSLTQCRSSLCIFFGFLPLQW
ncbi:hypothetical protein SAMN05421753_112104 [Planctomicrobium piriforme]|uniref:RiboL-PSP-HEPN domain-containing protein n=1 Tax=Planctomicrobium piriforme TaxID=1576369 RepID=A0A1I3L0U3_9PLAN|nr:hypothetical protein SAMN05421753_112104 [Planctomicrobium piriforme]